MIDSYEEGQKLYAEDFIDDYYLPEGKYEYCEVESIDDDVVTLVYHGAESEDTMTWTRAEMEHMLGWDLGSDDDRFEDGSDNGSDGDSARKDDESKPSEDELEFF